MKRAFTLVEIMVVVGIVVTLITLTVPNILRSRMVTNEAAALANIKIIADACQIFSTSHTNYPVDLDDLVKPVSDPPYIDDVLATGSKQSYDFVYNQSGDGFTLRANPSGIFATLNAKYFYTNETGIIRAKAGSTAGPDDTAVQ